MYQVLLVDDDLIVRMFLKDTLEWSKFGFEVAGDARDGEEALELAGRLKPDLILTDISMPRMDGIELIRRLRAGGYDGVLVALSCHDDFELVKSALQSGADEYLLKNHINEDSMCEMMQNIRSQVDERRKTMDDRRQLQALAREGKKSRQRDVLAQLLTGALEEDELPGMLEEAGLAGVYRRCALLLFQPVGADGRQVRSLFDLCTRSVGEAEFVALSPTIGAAILDLGSIPSARGWEERIHGLCTRLAGFASQYLALPLVLGVSAVCEGGDALTQALEQAYAAFQGGFYQPGQYLFGACAMPEDVPAAAAAFLQQLNGLLEHGEAKALKAAYQCALDAFAAARTHPGSVLEWLHSCDRAAGVRRKESFYASLKRFAQYSGCVDEYLRQQAARQSEQLPAAAGPAVREAVRYIRGHYQESIGLGHAARAAGLAPTYLSALFKKEMGVGFAEYLLDTRLAHVKRGLKEREATVKELSEQAGFPDYQHFCKTFKKKVGLSPRDYRRSLENKN